MHQMNFQSAMQYSRESLQQWADRILNLATFAFPSVPDVQVYAIPHCALELGTKMLVCMPLMVSPRLWMEYCTTSSRGGTDWLAQ